MALQVWLPLNGNLKNNGCADVTAINNGAIVDGNGKIGQCYSFDGSDDFISVGGDVLYSIFKGGSQPFSIAFWIYHNDSSRAVLFGDYSLTGSINFNIELTTSHTFRFYWAASPDKTFTESSVGANTWTHVCVTYNGSKIIVYINGVALSDVYNGTLAVKNKTTGVYYLGRDSRTGTTALNGKLNDFRIYNHCLSAVEVKEISRGLILHYRFDSELSNTKNVNLIADGWGGTDNWRYPTYTSTDVPTTPSGIQRSYYGSNNTKEYINIYQEHSYTISAYVKKYSSSATTCYLSLIPYDVDKNRISALHIRDGFRTSSLTTLSQDLHDGDTIVHLTDASGWANPTTNQNYVAIFGYADSTGYIYPDLVYTRRVYAYGTTTDKSNLDVANNQVTLINAYAGDTIPAGTSVCLSAAGSSYYYPITVSASNATDWYFLTKTFVPKDINFLKPAKCVQFISNGTYQLCAGITLLDNTADLTIPDSSGYGNDATIVGGTLLTNVNSSRYDKSAYMNNASTANHIEANKTVCSDNKCTISFWVKSLKSSQVLVADPGVLVIGLLNNLMYLNPASAAGFTTTNFVGNEWNHIVAIKDGTTYRLYINGIAEVQNGASNYYTHTGDKLYLLNRKANNNYAGTASLSDLRIYNTVLSQEDILQLYNVSGKIDNQKNLHCYELKEHDTSDNTKLFKTGVFKAKEFNEIAGIMKIKENLDVESNELIEI